MTPRRPPPLALLLLLAAAAVGGHAAPSLTIEVAERELDIFSGTVAERTSLTIRAGSAPVSTVALCTTEDLAAKRAYLEVVDGNGDTARKLATTPLTTAAVTALAGGAPPPPGTACVGAALKEPLAPGKTSILAASAVHTRSLVPLPATRAQDEPHRVAFNASHVLLSPYTVANQTLVVDFPSKAVLAATIRQPMKDGGDGVLTFGPFDGAPEAPWAVSPLFLHFIDDNPTPRALTLDRDVTVSHWGVVSVDESFDLLNAGAALEGEWSRYDFDTAPARSPGKGASLTALSGTLPKAARWVYFRDGIGNISSSSVRPSRSRLDIRLEPRFPLSPGWRTTFKFGYSLPLPSVTARDASSGRIRLTIPLGTPLKGVAADVLATTVVLPEGASAIAVDTPFGDTGVVTITTGTRATTLDTVGRPTVTATIRNAVSEHMAAPLVVSYAFTPARVLVEPLMLVAAFAGVFGVAMVARRTDLSLGGGEKVKGA